MNPLYALCTLLATLFLAFFATREPASSPTQTPPKPSAEVMALLDQGKALEKRNRAEAIRLYERALQTARELKDSSGEAESLLCQGWVQFSSEPRKAITSFSKASEIFRGNGNLTQFANCLLGLGNASSILSEFQEGIAYFEEMGRVYEDLKNKAGRSMALNGIGQILQRQGKTRKALEHLKTALAMLKEAGGPLVKRNSPTYLVNIGTCHLDLGEITLARDAYDEARRLAHEAGNTTVEVRARSHLGTVYSRLGETRQALEHLEYALPHLESMGQDFAAGYCLRNIAKIHQVSGDLMKFLEYETRAIETFKRVGQRGQAAHAMCGLGSFYRYLGQRHEAEKHFQMALAETQDTQDLANRISVLRQAGEFYGETEQPLLEKQCLDEALQLMKLVKGTTSEASVQSLSLGYLRRSGRLSEARTAGERMRDISRSRGLKSDEAVAERDLGQIAAEAGRLKLARQHFDRWASLKRQIGHSQCEAEALAAIGEIEERQGQSSTALTFYARALNLKETARASLGILSEAKIGWQAAQIPYYRDYISLLVRLRRQTEAFEWTQKAKARVLIDFMESGGVDMAHLMSEAHRRAEKEFNMRQKVLAYHLQSATGELSQMERKPPSEPGALQETKSRVERIRADQQKLESEWQAFYDRLYAGNPRLAQQRAARVIRLDETTFLPSDAAMLEFAYLKYGVAGKHREEVALFVVTREGGRTRSQMFRITPPNSPIRRLASELRDACAGRPGSSEARNYQEAARSLYELLIAPAEPLLAGKKRLIVCPDGPLWNVPVQTLLSPISNPKFTHTSSRIAKIQNPKSQYLWERFAISYGYSATGTHAALGVRGRPNRPRSERPLLVMADPQFGPFDTSESRSEARIESSNGDRIRGMYLRSGRLGALPHTRVEAGEIARAFPESVVKMQDHAQETVFKEEGARFRLLHFATHALVNDAAPMLSGVVLSQPPKGSKEDGVLTARELFNMNLSADLVVFSACETGRGARKRGEGMIGLTWAAMAAGIPSQVVSQWAVDDEATAELMKGFYGELRKGKPKDRALRTAGLSMLRKSNRRHPFYWAPFMLVGDWR